MKKIYLTLCIVIVTFLAGNSQENDCGYKDGVVWVVIEDDSIAPIKTINPFTKPQR